ncbi:hypothetical protein, partial [Tropheryma whipplei]|uniref:hypothetical protein n=1 Tax=Tropheryma whipplei TaxID=2039 RepID=UPI0005A6093C
ASTEIRQHRPEPEHPLKSVNEQIKTVTGAVNNFQKSVLTSLKNFFTYLTSQTQLPRIKPYTLGSLTLALQSTTQQAKVSLVLLQFIAATLISFASHPCRSHLPPLPTQRRPTRHRHMAVTTLVNAYSGFYCLQCFLLCSMKF